MQIAQVVCHLPPVAGGLGMAAHSFAEQLAERGYDVTVFVPRAKKDQAASKNYKVKILFPWLRFGLGAWLPQLFWHLRNFDIIHLHYPFFASALITALVKRWRGDRMRFIITYHQDVKLPGWKSVYESVFRKLLLKFILDSADRITVSSEDYVENSNIQDYYFQHVKKFTEIPFGVPRFLKPEEKDPLLMRKYGFHPTDRVVVFVGGLGPQHYFKGVNQLIRAWALIEDLGIKALIVGDGSLRKHYERLAEKLKLTGRVKFAGYVENPFLCKHYNLADMVILPSINSNEAYGIVLVEAMACGKPVLASNLKGVRAVVDSGQNGLLVEPGNSRDIAEKIQYLANNPALLKKFRANCLETVEKKYRWPAIIDKLLKVYRV